MNSQSELTVKRPRSFTCLSVAEMRDAYLVLNLSQIHIPRDLACTWKHLMRSLCFESRVSTTMKSCISMTIESRASAAIKNRISTAIEIRLSTIIEGRVSATIHGYVSTLLKFVSLLDQQNNCVYEGYVLSYTRSMSLLLQSVH